MCALLPACWLFDKQERCRPIMPNSAKPTSAPGIEIPASVQSLPWELKKTVAYWERLG